MWHIKFGFSIAIHVIRRNEVTAVRFDTEYEAIIISMTLTHTQMCRRQKKSVRVKRATAEIKQKKNFSSNRTFGCVGIYSLFSFSLLVSHSERLFLFCFFFRSIHRMAFSGSSTQKATLKFAFVKIAFILNRSSKLNQSSA